MRRPSRSAPPGHHLRFAPVQVDEVELGTPLPSIRARTAPDGDRYRRARVLVRLHSYPLGFVDVPLAAAGIARAALAEAIEADLADRIRQHLAADGVLPPANLAGSAGGDEEPACQSDRRMVLADPPSVSVVIPTRDRPEALRRCLASVLACEYPPDRREVVVVDNVPSDERTRALIESEHGRNDAVRYIVAPRSGSASARNDGVAAAEGSIVACTDDDMVVDRHWLPELVRGFAADPGVGCVTGLILPGELDTSAQSLFERYGGFGKGFARGLFDLRAHRPDDPLFPYNPGAVGSGSNVAFRRADLLAAGGYDPDLGNGTPTRSGEDLELFLRLLRRGHVIAYEPGAIAWHIHHREFRDLHGQVYDYGLGIGALLTRTVAREPVALLEIGTRLPRGLWYLFASSSPPNRGRGRDFPRSLRRAELRGVAQGPIAYLRSRRQARRAVGA